MLVSEFLRSHGSGHDSQDIEEPVWPLLTAYDYPGNLRELKSIVQSAANLARGKSISVHHLPAAMLAALSTKQRAAAPNVNDPIVPLAAMEKEYILKVYRSTGHNKIQTARLLEIGLNTLRRKLQSY